MGYLADLVPRRVLLSALLATAASLLLFIALRSAEDVRVSSPPSTAFAEAPLSFEPNAGRFPERFDFLSTSIAGGSLYVGSGHALLRIPEGRAMRSLRLGFLGASPAVEPVRLQRLEAGANSFIGDDPARWRTGLPTFARVRYPALYPGIDLDFHGDQRALEYDFRLAPGADPGRIAVELSGADRLRIAGSGDLVARLGGATVRQRAPVAYQPLDGGRVPVEAAFVLRDGVLGFRLGDYDRGRPLVIDPVLTHSTYLGGSLEDFGFDVAVDDEGAVYVSGQTASANFPTHDQLFPDQAMADAYLAKFNPTKDGEAMTLAYSTYLGASKEDFGASVAVDAEGAAYLAGTTDSNNFPTVDPLAGAAGGDLNSFDTYLTKLSPDSGGAVEIEYSTYLSGSGSEFLAGLAVDDEESAYLVGSTDALDFPVKLNFQNDQKDGDMFLTRFNPDNGGPVSLTYSTYLGGDGNQDRAGDVAVDGFGAAYVVGSTDSANFPTQDAFQTDKPGFDATLTKVSPYSGAPIGILYSTYLGGTQPDFGFDVAVDEDRAAYVVGATESADFPSLLPFMLKQPEDDGFVTKVEPDGGGTVALAYSTFLGGSKEDSVNAVEINPEGDAVVIGNTASPEFPVSPDPLFPNLPDRDAIAAVLHHAAGKNVTVPFSTYLGGDLVDEGNAVAVGPEGAIYVSGSTTSSDFPIRNEFQADQGAIDSYLTRIAEPEPQQPPPGPPGQGPGAASDTAPPETTITKRPRKKLRTRAKRAQVSFRFASSEPGSRFECRFDRGRFAPCVSPRKLRPRATRKARRHTFLVRAIDASGNVDPTPARAKVAVVTRR